MKVWEWGCMLVIVTKFSYLSSMLSVLIEIWFGCKRLVCMHVLSVFVCILFVCKNTVVKLVVSWHTNQARRFSIVINWVFSFWKYDFLLRCIYVKREGEIMHGFYVLKTYFHKILLMLRIAVKYDFLTGLSHANWFFNSLLWHAWIFKNHFY